MYDITITDSTGTQTMPESEVPLTISELEGTTDVTTLDFNLYTDFVAKKRTWSHTWAYMSEDEFNVIKGYYDRQFTLYQYPKLTIEGLGVNQVTARMTLSPQNIIDNCGMVQGVTVSFRESQQISVSTDGLLAHESGIIVV